MKYATMYKNTSERANPNYQLQQAPNLLPWQVSADGSKFLSKIR